MPNLETYSRNLNVLIIVNNIKTKIIIIDRT